MFGAGHGSLKFTKENHPTKFAVKVAKVGWPGQPSRLCPAEASLAVIGGGHGGLKFTKENHPTKFAVKVAKVGWFGPQDCAQQRPGLAVIGGHRQGVAGAADCVRGAWLRVVVYPQECRCAVR